MESPESTIIWDAVIDRLPLGACLISNKQTILCWNSSLERWTGISKQESIDKEVRKIFPHLQSREYELLLQSIFVNGTFGIRNGLQAKAVAIPSYYESGFTIRQISISPVPLEGAYAALLLFNELSREDGEMEAKHPLHVELSQEIEKRKTLEEELKQTSAALAKINQHKFRFLSNMSHELRTPLNSILLLSRLLVERDAGNLTSKQVEFAETIHTAGSDLLQMINDILDHSKADAGKMEVARLDLAIESVLTRMDRYFRSMAEEQGLSFTVQRGPDLPAEITTDPQKLEQILKNLLSNAIKFTSHGGVTLSVASSTDRISSSGEVPIEKEMVFSVTDTGIGIEEKMQEKVFEAFHQIQDSAFHCPEGTGLGLAISKKFAALLHGEIVLSSTPGKGSTFSLYIPAPSRMPAGQDRAAHETDPGEMQSSPSGKEPGGAPPVETMEIFQNGEGIGRRLENEIAGLKGMKLLVVGKEMRSLYMLSNKIEAWDMKVIIGKGTEQARTRLEKTKGIDLLLLDITEPFEEGLQVLQDLCGRGKAHNVPIVAMLPQSAEGEQNLFTQAGASSCLLKPLKIRQLVQTLLSLGACAVHS